jgi:hypothetical protein
MLFTTKDKVATGLLVAALAVYIGYLITGGFLFVQDVRGMAAVGLLLGFLSRRIGGREDFVHMRAARFGGISCIALGFMALFTESTVLLALFMALTVGLWAAAMFVKSGAHFGHVRTTP